MSQRNQERTRKTPMTSVTRHRPETPFSAPRRSYPSASGAPAELASVSPGHANVPLAHRGEQTIWTPPRCLENPERAAIGHSIPRRTTAVHLGIEWHGNAGWLIDSRIQRGGFSGHGLLRDRNFAFRDRSDAFDVAGKNGLRQCGDATWEGIFRSIARQWCG